MRQSIIYVAFMLACCTCVRSSPRVGAAGPNTKYECPGKKLVVDDPTKCDVQK